MIELDWATGITIASNAAGIGIILLLAYLVRQDWPRPKIVTVLIWAVIWAIGGAIVGQVDDDINRTTAILLGAFWGTLLALLQESGWSLRNREKE